MRPTHPFRRTVRTLAAGAALATSVSLGAVASPAVADHTYEPPPGGFGSAGDETITVPINDSAAGGTYYQPFEKAYAGATPDGTPVFVYVPTGTFDGVEGTHSLDPAFDHNPDDEFVPCADAEASDFAITQEQVDYLGDELANQIVDVDEQHFGDLQTPPGGDSEALVTLVYNVQDDAYYDCAADSYTAGYFASDYLSADSLGMNVMVIDALDLARLDDTLRYFPPYDAVPVVRTAALLQHAAIPRALARLAGRISEKNMRAMNRAVDVDRRDVRDVAREFLNTR